MYNDHKDELKFTPIFILGMPRSGTTLLEQVLSSHSKIHGAGELIYLPQITWLLRNKLLKIPKSLLLVLLN